MPSAITPHHVPASARAAPATPGWRAESGGIALNRWVKPVTPAATACVAHSNEAALWPAQTRTPAPRQAADRRVRHAFRRQRQQHRAGAGAQHVQIGLIRRADQAGRMHAWALAADERAFEVDAEHAGLRLGHHLVGRQHRRARVGDQRGQDLRGAEPAVRRGDGARGCLVRPVVEQHAAATVHLQIDQPWCQQAARRQLHACGLQRLAGRQHGGEAAGPRRARRDRPARRRLPAPQHPPGTVPSCRRAGSVYSVSPGR